ncbi:GNAT family N-acetyltransferase [Larkinella rosea]|uniref:GNAT family N-acetyltransferase n=1 Tax=Larkinella rosea TaxID=2025312 RepID=A0A3P1C2F1_9BACT|nr:GNAT family N-acetyltransferase [Larkinella rosea]RRB07561.1 GNAT family N-acetyltransferase [Larkinella rosea]
MKILSLTDLNEEQYLSIQALEIRCKADDALLGHIHWDKSMNYFQSMCHWFLLYDNGVLISVLSAFAPTTNQIEFNGYTLPKARRKGCYSTLLEVAAEEARKYGYEHALLISEQSSESGQAFVKQRGAQLTNTEYQLIWQAVLPLPTPPGAQPVQLVKAESIDLEPLTTLSQTIFGGTLDEARKLLETTIQSPHLTQYVATLAGKTVGMVATNFVQNDAWIIGLGVCQEHQGQGIGQTILHRILAILQDSEADKILIEVDSSNEAALHLYQKTGFEIQMGQDYFRLAL